MSQHIAIDAVTLPRENSLTPTKRYWQRFRNNRLGFYSFCILVVLIILSLSAELISNERPLFVQYKGQWYFPVVQDIPETVFGGDFPTPTDFLDPFIADKIKQSEGIVLHPINSYSAASINYYALVPNPAPPSADNRLGTDRQGRDMIAQLIYGFRVSILFGIALTAIGIVLGILAGAVQGYFAGKVDLVGQRLIEVWSAMPELYILIIFSAIFKPTIMLLLVLLSLFSWVALSDYVRAEFLRNRQMDYVRSARALGLSHWQIIWRHVLPNSMMPVITFLPFRLSAAILALTSLDFLGLGVPPNTPSLGQLLAQGKQSLDAWWISLPTFAVLVAALLLLTFTGDGLRNALDPRHQNKNAKKKVADKAIKGGRI